MKGGRSVLAAGCLVTLALAGCGPPPPERPAKVILVLFDLSESTATQAMRTAYADTFRAVASTIGPGDALVAGWITDRSAAELTLPVRLAIPPFEPGTDNPPMVTALRTEAEAKAKLEIDRACTTIEAGLRGPGRKVLKTSIMSSLAVAERVFASDPRPRKLLVLVSDMLEDSEHYVFDRMKLGPAEASRIIATERAAARLPDLAGVTVHVAGAAAATDEKLFEVQRFWLAYMHECGADLRKEHYGAALIGYEE
jgi:hypothetical protein